MAATGGYFVATLVAPAALRTTPPVVQTDAAVLTPPEPESLIGERRPDFALADSNGRMVSSDAFEGDVLLVNFWATWCTPCKHEIPIFIDLVEQYKDEGFTVLGISTDDTAEDLVPFAEEFGINYPVLVGFGRDDLLDAYQAGFFVPTSWFIRRDGSVALKWPGTSTPEWFEEQVKLLVDDRPLASDGTR